MTAPASLEAVTMRYRGVVALDDMTLTIEAGEVVALVGLNGSGKTTLMRVLLGMTRPDAGTVRLWGTSIDRLPAATWGRVGHLIETPFAYPDLSVAENVWASARLHGVSGRASRTATDAILATLDLTGLADRRTRTLSLGNRQRVGIAAACVHRPDLVVLDEPTIALDPAAVVSLRDLIADLQAGGTAVLVSSHHLDEVARIATRSVVIHRGRLLGELVDADHIEKDLFAMAYAADQQRTATGETGPTP